VAARVVAQLDDVAGAHHGVLLEALDALAGLAERDQPRRALHALADLRDARSRLDERAALGAEPREHDDRSGAARQAQQDDAPPPLALGAPPPLGRDPRLDLRDRWARGVAGELGGVVVGERGDALCELARIGALDAIAARRGNLVERRAFDEPVGRRRHDETSKAWSLVRSLYSRLRTPDTDIPTSAATSSSVILSCRCRTAISAVSSGSWRNSASSAAR